MEMSFSIRNIRELDQVTGESPQLVKEALSQISLQLQAIPSLQTIVVRITGPKPALSTMDCMQSVGWTTPSALGNA